MAEGDPLIGQVIADRYLIQSAIGEGGMGRVYLAEHVRLGRKSALKVISRALANTADAISRFNREAANACKINHPNVAQVYDFGEMTDGTLYLAMEYIEGETLDALIAREGPLSLPRAAHVTKQIADALHAAHHLGIVHRDLKPENVMVARHLDGSDWVKVVDFGIAKTMHHDASGSQTVTTAGVSLGTPEYMSPEQLAGERLDHRTDVYSLGLLLFNLVTGQLPYPKLTSKETLVRRLTTRPLGLAHVRPDVRWPAALQRALDRALAPEVADRYGNVADFGRDVVLAVEPPSAHAAATVVSGRVARPVAPNAEASARRSVARSALVSAGVAAAVFAGVAIVGALRSDRAAPPPHVVRDSVAAPAVAVLPQGGITAPPSPPAPGPAHDTVPRSNTITTSDRTQTPTLHHEVKAAARMTKPPADSTAIRAPAAASPSAAAAREIHMHVDRMKQLFSGGDPRGARKELAEALAGLSLFRDLDHDPEHVAQAQREIGQGVREVVATCYRMRADSTLAPGIRCENLMSGARRREFARPR